MASLTHHRSLEDITLHLHLHLQLNAPTPKALRLRPLICAQALGLTRARRSFLTQLPNVPACESWFCKWRNRADIDAKVKASFDNSGGADDRSAGFSVDPA